MLNERSMRSDNNHEYEVEERDYLTHLPHDVLSGSILSRLSIRDAVSTSCICSNLKPLIATRPDLCFDWEAMFLSGSILSRLGRCFKLHMLQFETSCDCVGYTDKFVAGLNQFLAMYAKHNPNPNPNLSSSLRSFKVKFCLGKEYEKDIDQWVIFSLQRGAKKLALNLSCASSQKQDLSDNNCLYTFGSPQVLVELGRNLRLLELTNVSLGREEQQVHTIFSSCPKLKSLVLKGCRLPRKVSASGDELERLIIRDCSDMEEIEVSAIKLKKFESWDTKLVKFCFSGTVNLHEVCLVTYDVIDLHSLLRRLAVQVTGITNLTICAYGTISPETISIPTFNNVIELTLCLSHSDMTSMINILRAFPVINILYVNVNSESKFDRECEIMTAATNFHRHLEVVHIRGIKGSENEMEFVFNLLRSSGVALRHLIIIRNFGWEDGKDREIMEAVEDYFSKNKQTIRTQKLGRALSFRLK